MLNNILLQNKKEIKSDYLGEYIYNLGEQTFQMPHAFEYQIIEVTEDFIGRMDLISKHIYGDSCYSDVLCKINGISNPFELNDGDKIVIPSLDSLSSFMYRETDEERDDSSDNEKPQPKTKVDKRKPNESIVGDKRYKIDKNNRLIVY